MANPMQRLLVAAAALGCLASAGWADYDVRVDLKNLSGEEKANWPVVLRVYTVLGRDLPAGSVNPEGFHVYDPSGREVPHMVEKLPPYDQPGNDELVFVVPRMKPGEVASYRITNTAVKSSRGAKIDLVGGPHNLIANGSFEEPSQAGPANFGAPATRDELVARGGKHSLMLTADNETVSTRYAKPIGLHKDSWYYFGVWSKTQAVSRFGYEAGDAAHFRLLYHDPQQNKDVSPFSASLMPQCSTRDWLKVTFEGGVDDWGVDRYVAKAAQPQTSVEFVLQQRRHFYMEPGKTRGTWWLDDAVLMEQPEVSVRFDLSLKPLLEDGLFVFTRPPLMPLGRLDEKKRGQQEWCAMPYAHEKLTRLDKFAVKGQRVSYCVGVYHTREVKDVVCRVAGGALKAGPARLAPELIEYSPGYLGPDRRRYMAVLNSDQAVQPVTLAGEKGVRYFFITFHVPPDAQAGKYTGQVELAGGEKVLGRYPLTLRVQDMVQPIPQDVFVGLIYQGNDPRWDEEGLTVYGRSGFNCVTRFGGFFAYRQGEDGKWQVDTDKMHETMMWLKKHGMAGVCVFSDFDLGPKWDGGSLLKRVRPADFGQRGAWGERLKSAEAAYKAQIKRIEAARKAHPEWPTFIYMTWDEPELHGGRNGLPDPAMAWVNQVAPDALTTLDVQFNPLPVCIKWYTVPAFDDPATWAGPEVYRWVKKQGKEFGYCGAADNHEAARFQAGMLMLSTGAKYHHAWHLTGGHIAGHVAYDGQTKKLLRAPSMINWGDGMNDLKAHSLLAGALGEAEKDPKKAAAVKAARAYLKAVFTTFNGDHRYTWTLQPYLGTAFQWGYEQFYDDWQEQMLKHAAALKGVKWIE